MEQAKLPASLWNNGALCMPHTLKDALRDELRARKVYKRACEHHNEHEVFGGESDEETLKHFADRFKNSAARVAYVLLSPEGHFPEVSLDVLASMFDGTIAILDIPCGSGGGLHGLLASVAELRKEKHLPRTPVRINILGGDFSPLARIIHGSMLARVKDAYQALGMRLEWDHVHWDVTDPYSTTAMMDRWLSVAGNCEEHLVLVSAFSGFAIDHVESVTQAVRDITVRLRSKMLHLVWIEPGINQAKGLFRRLSDAISRYFFGKHELTTSHYKDPVEFFFRHPFVATNIPTRARVIRFQRFGHEQP